MNDVLTIVEGDTETVAFQLTDGGIVPEQPLTGGLVLTVRNFRGGLIPTTGKTAVLDPEQWLVGYTPASGDLLATGGLHRLHWTVDQDGAEFSFPRGPGLEVQVSQR